MLMHHYNEVLLQAGEYPFAVPPASRSVELSEEAIADAAWEIIAALVSTHGGLVRDHDGWWWTWDHELCLATPSNPVPWEALNRFARRLGYDA